MKRLRQIVFGSAAIAAAQLVAAPAVACSVCWGNADDPMIEGAKLAIGFMLGLVYLVLGGGVAAAVLVRRSIADGGEGEDG